MSTPNYRSEWANKTFVERRSAVASEALKTMTPWPVCVYVVGLYVTGQRLCACWRPVQSRCAVTSSRQSYLRCLPS